MYAAVYHVVDAGLMLQKNLAIAALGGCQIEVQITVAYVAKAYQPRTGEGGGQCLTGFIDKLRQCRNRQRDIVP